MTPELKRLAALRSISMGQRADRVLTALAREFPDAGRVFGVGPRKELGMADVNYLVSVGWCIDRTELLYIIEKYLSQERHFLSASAFKSGIGSNEGTYEITPAGWAHIDSLSHGNPASEQGFIAMWFNDEVNSAAIAIEAGIGQAGYRPLRIDRKQHNNEITDEIIAEIRKSKFLVADLTEHRNGVYFEAGFAKGLGLEVIWLCRENQHTKAHFDVRQYNCILWTDSALPALTKALKDRIEATLGRGPLGSAASA